MPTGPEMAIQALIRWIGIKPEHLLEPLQDIHTKVIDYDRKLTEIEQHLSIIRQQLREIYSIIALSAEQEEIKRVGFWPPNKDGTTSQ